jgi:hypothetical protein
MKHEIIQTENYLLVVDDSEIKTGDYVLSNLMEVNIFGRLYTPSLYKKIIAHLPIDSPILEGVDLLPPLENKVEHIDDLAFKAYKEQWEWTWSQFEQIFPIGYNKAKEKYKYTEEDIDKAYWAGMKFVGEDKGSYKEFIQSLQQPRYPVAFECEIVDTSNMGVTLSYPLTKTITNSQGLTQLVGKYIFNNKY